MPCHQHRCCRRPAATDVRSLDYVLLAAYDENMIEGSATLLRGAGASAERHELGLRVNCRGANWQAALAHLVETLAAPARRGLRVALIPIAADDMTFRKALLMSQSLDVFVQSLGLSRPATAKACAAAVTASGQQPLGDVFKGESLE
jgi:hypothetical protein